MQNFSSNGTLINGGGPASVSYGLVNANMNPVAWHPQQYNNYINQSMMGIPLVLPHHHTNFSFGDETSGSSRRRQRRGSNMDPNKRCTNSNCNTSDTPMWRKGPLGPKTLCNACGTKYRKEEERKRAREAEPSPSNAQL